MKLKDTLTILIPLWGRDRSTKILLKYMSAINVPFRILMADGGGSDNSDWISKDNFPNLDVEYHNYGSDDNIHKFMRKMDLACSSITTPLTIMLDNDDFFSLGGLIAGVDFLSKNDDFASFRENVRGYHDGRDIYTNGSIASNHPTQRIVDLFAQGRMGGGINSAWHDMCRTHILQKMFKIMHQSKNEDFQLSHSVNKFWSLFYGKAHKGHEKPYMYHMSGNSLVQGKGIYSKYKDWIHDSKFKNSMAITASLIKGILRDRDPISTTLIQELIIQDPYDLGGHTLASDATIDSILEMSHEYDDLVNNTLDEPDKPPSSFVLDEPAEFEFDSNSQLIEKLIQ